MFWRIDFTNAWRNLERSLLAIISIALAAGFMTNATSFSRGYSQQLYASYRSIIGGEISAYSLNFNLSSGNEDTEWRYRELLDVQDTDLALMMPELEKGGYISPKQKSKPFSEETVAAMEEISSLSGVYQRYQIPAMSCDYSGMWSTPLRGRDLQLDTKHLLSLANYISQGRWFEETDDGAMVAVICSQQNYPSGHRLTGVSDTLQILVPRISEQDGTVHYNYTEPLMIELRVIGVLDMTTREISYTRVVGGGEAEFRVKMQMVSDEIQVPLTTWQNIWHAAGGDEYLPQQLSLMVEDLSYLEDIVLEMRQAYPMYSFYSVPQLVRRVQAEFTLENPEPALLDPYSAERVQRITEPEQAVLAQDLRLPLMILIFINAALVVASNLLIMVSERKKEIGILKTVGATRSQVVQMVLSEALLVSVIGSLFGFAFFRLPAALNQWTNGVSLSTIMATVAGDFAMVIGVACLSTAVFAMIPAIQMANLSVRETVQGDSV